MDGLAYDNIRKLNRILSIKYLSYIYISWLVYAKLILIYSKGHVLSIKLICGKYTVMT